MDENSFRAISATSVEDAFQEIRDYIFNTFGEPGKTVAQTDSIILEKVNDKVYVLQEYNQYLSDQLFKIVNFTGTKFSDKEKMFSVFLQQSLDPLRREPWKNFCAKIGVEICSQKVGDLLYGSLLDGFLRKSLQSKNKLCCKQVSVEAAEESYPLSQDEEETTRYIAGYIIFSLKNLMKGKKLVEAVATRQMLSCWGRNTDIEFDKASLYEYTREWVDHVNRGGLIEVTDDFFLFIKLIEFECRKILNITFLITYSGQDFRDQLCSKITNSELLQRDWDLLTKDLNDRLLCDKLFHRIVTKWVNIRINAFIKTWMQIMRRESEGMNKPGAQAEVSLRKSLH